MDCWLKKTLECEPWAVGYCDYISQCFPNLYELTNESINEKKKSLYEGLSLLIF